MEDQNKISVMSFFFPLSPSPLGWPLGNVKSAEYLTALVGDLDIYMLHMMYFCVNDFLFVYLTSSCLAQPLFPIVLGHEGVG